ncbi:baseplate J/gp47 family protein, partial [Candidatus Pacearchaeota archaeon]|nr:baseplate J/gp47 family protein [Candidatus Pacearchaeota archaeon]
IETSTNQDSPPVDIAYNRILANALAPVALLNKLHNIDQRKECFPQTASEEIGLPLWGALTNRPRGQAVSASHVISIAGVEDTVVGTYGQGPLWKGSDGNLYDTSIGGTITGGVLDITITARTPGEQGTLSVGAEVTLTKTISGINDTGVVQTVVVAGQEQESVDSWRAAIIQITAFPPNIGTSSWFFSTSLTIEGVTRVFPYNSETLPGKVEIFVAADDNVDGQPTQGQLDAIELLFGDAPNDVMWSYKLLPSGDKRVEAFASPVDTYDVVITDGSPSLSQTLKDKIEVAIDNYFATRAPYIRGLSIEDYGAVEKVAVITVAQNVIEAQPTDTGRFADIDVVKQGDAAEDIYIPERGHRAKAEYSYT